MPNPLHPFVSILGNHHPCKIVLGSGGWVPKTFQSRVWQTAKTTLLISFILGFWLDVPFLDNLKNKHIQRKKKKMMVTTVHNLSFPASNAACGVYLAPSTIPNAGLGMYAGTDFETDEEFLPFGDSVVGIYDISVHHSGGKVLERFLWDEYTWNAKAMHMGDEGVQEVTVTSSGFGAAANCQLSIVNVVEYYPLMYLTPLHPSRDPGAGGFSNFHYRKATAKRNIQAGQELFVSYGNDWFKTREHLGPIPLTDDLATATALLQKYQQLRKRRRMPVAVLDDAWDIFVNHTIFKKSRVLSPFSNMNRTEIERLQQQHGSNLTEDAIAKSTRNLEWLRENGSCADHLVALDSTIPQAGKGAFARRNLTKASVVSHLPMIHITNRYLMNMFGLVRNGKGVWTVQNRTTTRQQLLLNYCYGHNESTMLLCPYSPVTNYINHNRSLANVKLQWAQESSGNHMPRLLNASIAEIASSDATAKLAMELIATRDIQAGEEIFLDYGDDWEAAWNEHMQNWKPLETAKNYVAAAQLNAEPTIRSIFEELENPLYPDNVELKCDTAFKDFAAECKKAKKSGTLEEYLWHADMHWWHCEVLQKRIDKKTGETLYTVHMFERVPQGNQTATVNSIRVKDIPRQAFHFVDLPYTSDIFLPNAFRHHIGIADELFPHAWRNLRITPSPPMNTLAQQNASALT